MTNFGRDLDQYGSGQEAERAALIYGVFSQEGLEERVSEISQQTFADQFVREFGI